MKTFSQFITEVYDKDVMGSSQISKRGEGGRIGSNRKKSEPEKRRMKAVGDGKTVPAKTYKDRKDIGNQRQASTRQQQPEKERGSARKTQLDSAKEERKKAALARIAAKKGGKPAPEKKKTPSASELLSKKKKSEVSPNYTQQKASGKTRAERDKIRGEGERYLKSIMKDQETEKYKKETGQNPDSKGRTKILGRVNKRMK